MNETNRAIIILLAGLVIVLMAVIIFAAWAADAETVNRLRDFVQYLDDHRDNASRLILTLGALVVIVLALLVIIVELAPEEETREIRVEQAGATTIVPAQPLRLRLEEALTALPYVTEAKARVFSHDKGVGMKLDITVTPNTNVALATQEAHRIVVETLQADLGLPVSGPPTVRILFGPPAAEPVASSTAQPPSAASETPGEPAPPAGEPPSPPEPPAGQEPPPEPPREPEGERPLWSPSPQQPAPESPPSSESRPEEGGPPEERPPEDEPRQQ